MMRRLLGAGVAIFSIALFTNGCVVTAEPATYGTVVYDEPPPEQRVYIYDPGYPPGCYYYGDDVYYSGHAYRRDVFVTQVVDVNIRQNRYVNVEENHRYVNNYVTRDNVRYQSAHPNYRGPEMHGPGEVHPQDRRSPGPRERPDDRRQ